MNNRELKPEESAKVRQFWGRINSQDMNEIKDADTLRQVVQTKYGLLREEAEDQVSNFLTYCARNTSKVQA